MNSLLGGNPNTTYLVVNNIGTPTGSGVDFVNGFVFLYVLFFQSGGCLFTVHLRQRFYTVFNSDSSEIGFANTVYTIDNVN